jgi:type IV pilus assembly protein PilA
MESRGKRQRARGFTLVELMGVVAIMGVLFILVMPYIRGYTIRAKVTEGMTMIAQCRNQVYEVYASGTDLPGDNGYGCEAVQPSRFVQEVTTTNDGVIVLMLGNQIADLRLSLFKITLAPLNGSGQRMSDADLGTIPRRWRCGSTLDGTDVELAAYLPSTCRG